MDLAKMLEIPADKRLPVFPYEELPSLFRAADRASAEARARYMRLAFLNFALMVLVAAIGLAGACYKAHRPSPGPGHPDIVQTVIAIASASAFLAGVVLTLLLRVLHYARVWYDGRALAESVKTLAWRYMLRAEPFGKQLSDPQADDAFSRQLAHLRQRHDDLARHMDLARNLGPQITARMREVRAKDVSSRLEFYITYRLNDQRLWYARRASESRTAARRWIVLIVLSQVAGALSALVQAVVSDLPYGFSGLFASLAAAFLGWLQLRRHQELSQAYNLAALDLSEAAEQAARLGNEENLGEYVNDAENAMSREHISWLARQRSQLRLPKAPQPEKPVIPAET